MWLKQNKVDLALGVMINPGSQPTVKEMVRLGMGPHLEYKMIFGVATPSHLPCVRSGFAPLFLCGIEVHIYHFCRERPEFLTSEGG